MFSTYILKSLKDNKYYIGCTNDFARRFEQHNIGKVKSTKHRTPLALIRLENYQTLKVATNLKELSLSN